MQSKTITILQWLTLIVGVGLLASAFYSKVTLLYLLGGIFFAVGAAIYVYNYTFAKNKNYLLQNGRLIQADFTEVAINQGLEVNGRNPFQIIAQWHDKTSNQLHIYKSENLWFDPTQFIGDKKMSVYIDENNAKKHYMDISFLPKIAN